MNPYAPKKTYAGYIFDCDGTLADTMPLHFGAWTHALKKAGAPFVFSYEQMCSWGGKSLRQTVLDLNAMHGTALCAETIRAYQAEYIHEHLPLAKPREEIVALARELSQSAPVAVASGGFRAHVLTTLQAIGVRDLFGVVVTQEDVEHNKPAPDIFLLAAKQMGVDPAQCLVYEDSPTGIKAAQAAGMDYIVVA